jgi:hypothetical protein
MSQLKRIFHDFSPVDSQTSKSYVLGIERSTTETKLITLKGAGIAKISAVAGSGSEVLTAASMKMAVSGLLRSVVW